MRHEAEPFLDLVDTIIPEFEDKVDEVLMDSEYYNGLINQVLKEFEMQRVTNKKLAKIGSIVLALGIVTIAAGAKADNPVVQAGGIGVGSLGVLYQHHLARCQKLQISESETKL